MKCLTKEKFFKILLQQFELESIANDELKKEYIDNLYTIVDELYDNSKDVVQPLSKHETYIFRKKYGILDSGICQSCTNIAKENDLSSNKVLSIVNLAFRKIRNYSISSVETPCTVEVSNNNSNYQRFDSILEVTIDKLDISVRSYNCLQRARIYRLGHLVKLSTSDLTKVRNLGQMCIEEIVGKVHECGLKFTDEHYEKIENKTIIDSENSLMMYQILKEEEQIMLTKQNAFLNKVNRKQAIKKLIKQKN